MKKPIAVWTYKDSNRYWWTIKLYSTDKVISIDGENHNIWDYNVLIDDKRVDHMSGSVEGQYDLQPNLQNVLMAIGANNNSVLIGFSFYGKELNNPV